MKAALVNVKSKIVEGLLMVNSLDDIVPKGYKLVEVDYLMDFKSEEEKSLHEILKEIDPMYDNTNKMERTIHPGVTKWTSKKGFYEE